MPPPSGMDNEARHKLASPISGELCKVGLPARPPSPHLPSSKRGNGDGGVSALLETPEVSKGLAVLLGGRGASLEGYRRRLEQVMQSHRNALMTAVLLDPVKGEPHRKNLGIPGFPAFWTVSLHGLRRPFAFPSPEESTMPLPPETFQLESPEPRPTGRSGFRVPFGLLDGRALAPAEVAKGKACGCVCPGCQPPSPRRPRTAAGSDRTSPTWSTWDARPGEKPESTSGRSSSSLNGGGCSCQRGSGRPR